MDITINSLNGIKLKTENTYLDEDINLSVGNKAFEEILYDGTSENGVLGENKLASLVDRTITEITESDLHGATKIATYAFYYNSVLISIEIPNSVTTISSSALSNCSSLTSVSIGSGVTSIGGNAFQNCSKLNTVTFAENSQLTTIGNVAFSGCSRLTSLTIPASVTKITNQGLQIGSSSNKATITFLGTTPPTIDSNIMAKSYLNQIIVPKGYGDTYKSATNWSDFTDYIVEAEE